MKQCIGCEKEYGEDLFRCPACGKTGWVLAPEPAGEARPAGGALPEAVPLGVHIVGALMLFVAILCAILALGAAGPMPAAMRVMLVACAAIDLALAVGLWRLQAWAWFAALVLFGLDILASLALVHEAKGKLILAAAELVCILYLCRRDVREVFLSAAPGRSPTPR